ncbi:MAG: SRPBCC domain-containing protein [Pseudomonadota bacterium]
MRYYAVEKQINADPDTVWAILTDANHLSDGSFSIISIDGTIAKGETIRLKSEVDPKRTFPIRISEMKPGHSMIWENGLPLGLFRGAREFKITPKENGTLFSMREEYTGPLAGLMFKMIPDQNSAFQTFAAGLAKAAEGTGN